MKPIIIGISGGTGAGKSWLADYLARHIPDTSARLQEDWYYRDRSELSEEEILRINFDHPSAIDAPKLLADVDALRGGRTIHAPQYDYATHSRAPATVTVESAPVILLEGLFVLHRPALRRRIGIRVFIDVPADLRLIRRIHRDTEIRRIPVEETLRLWENFVRPMHERFVGPSRRHAQHIWRPSQDPNFPRRLTIQIRRRLAPKFP